MSIESIKHKNDKRTFIPSIEEAGYEKANQTAISVTHKEFPKNPIVNRGQDPELFWMNKYGNDDTEDNFKIDIRSLYRHEHISPEILIKNFYKIKDNPTEQLSLSEMFGNTMDMDDLEKVAEYYSHQDDWSNRMILGDSLLVMGSLLEREGMAGKVQTIYMDPPYGIKYGSNWQIKLNNRDVKDGNDEHLTGEPEQIKAYRDTWELGIHSYLGYLRDRLVVVKELLTESGSCFVQISDENVHLVRCIMDEVFGSENFFAMINYRSMSPLGQNGLASVYDYILWYAKNKDSIKFRPLFKDQDLIEEKEFSFFDTGKGEFKKINTAEILEMSKVDFKKIFKRSVLTSSGYTPSCTYTFNFNGIEYKPLSGKSWRTHNDGMKKLIEKNRLILLGKNPYFRQYYTDFPFIQLENSWHDTAAGFSEGKKYVVQTNQKIISRCLLMTTDPGDLVLDPTCGSGTTATVAEQWGRRWITIDTSRIALNIAKTRVMTALYPYYNLYDESGKDIRQGFIYKKVPHITLKSLANDEPADEETLYDQPTPDNKKIRVAGPFTVETLQSLDILPPEAINQEPTIDDKFEERIFSLLQSAGIKNGIKNEHAIFTRIDLIHSTYLHAEGFYQSGTGEKKAYFFIGPKYSTVSKDSVNQAIKECRTRGDADWLVILGFSFESEISNQSVTASLGTFEVTKVRMNDDLLQFGLLKKDKKAASFVTIGEPDITYEFACNSKDKIIVEIKGIDIYDPIKDIVKPRDIHDISYWMLDDNYDGSNFIVKQIFFCGGDKDEFKNWKKGLSTISSSKTKKKLENTLKIEIDDEAFESVYGHKSMPINLVKKHQKVAVKVISQFGEEAMKVISI